ncbi:RcnB family protein [Hydrogenophaga sp. 5NK40-0174]|uniref:RcnB family protein n=1 Tax=Hydrogenophaga sp. 5NK40-0174 TaxID=3127649 RepID=UPI003103F03D
MKVRALASTLAAVSMGWAPGVHAQPPEQVRHARNEPQHALDLKADDDTPPQWRRYYSARGPQFQLGGPLPEHFRQRQYIVKQYAAHGLPRPPRSHHWVQIGPDYVLTHIASRLITHIQFGA